MIVSYLISLCSAGQKHTSGFAPLVGVPAMLSPPCINFVAPGHPTLYAVGVASLMNSLLTRRRGLMRRAWQRAASVRERVRPRR